MLTAVGAHPVTECAFVDTKLLRHSGDRARRLDHHLHSFIFEFRREALLRSRQLLHLSRRPSYWMDCPEASGHPILPQRVAGVLEVPGVAGGQADGPAAVPDRGGGPGLAGGAPVLAADPLQGAAGPRMS